MTGLDDFQFDYLSFNLFRLRIDYTVTIPAVRSSGEYNMNATVMDAFDVWGAGPFEFIAHSKYTHCILNTSPIQQLITYEQTSTSTVSCGFASACSDV